MNISALVRACEKPPVYTPGTAVMWTDPYISTQLLSIHLSQDTDLASRKTPAIEATLDFITAQMPEALLTILDLGCGPGLYTERLAARGHQVTGMDISAVSLDHARKAAREKNLAVTYINQDYLSPAPDQIQEGGYDLVMMIFTDFGVLTPDQRTVLLGRIRRALKPGGRFVFDVLDTAWEPRDLRAKSWDLSDGGFWRPGPCLTLSQTFEYGTDSPETGLFLSQHLVMDERELEIYRFYTHTFSATVLEGMLAAAGFRDIRCQNGILPDSTLYRSGEVTFCTAVKQA